MRKCTVIVTIIWFLSSTSCSFFQKKDGEPEKPTTQEEWVDFGLYVNGKAVFDLDEAGIEEIKKELDSDKELAARKDKLGGFAAYTYSQIIAALQNVSASRTVYKGRIKVFSFQKEYTPDGKRPGHFVIEVRKSHANGDVELLRWYVRVDDFKVVKRVGTAENHTNDVFPGTILLPPDRLDPDKEDNIWDRGLDYKLFAKGSDITVEGVWQKINNNRAVRLEDTHRFYQVDAESCVDMMFKGFPPDWTLPSQPAYCLGRCPVAGGVVLVNSR